MKEELQKYFNSVYPSAKIDAEYSLRAKVHIRFELGGNKENGTTERVVQAVERAIILFNDVFKNCKDDIWVLIYEYEGENIHNAPNEYLHYQFPEEKFLQFYNKKVNPDLLVNDVSGKRIIIGQIKVSEINIENILEGIANLEMGLEPNIDQRIFFFNSESNTAFQMYDDRGCYIWSNKADTIRNIYVKRNDWIVDYHRPEIDGFFK